MTKDHQQKGKHLTEEFLNLIKERQILEDLFYKNQSVLYQQQLDDIKQKIIDVKKELDIDEV